MWRYNPGIVKVLEAAREGWLGSIYMVRANIGNQLAANRRPEWAEFSGGVMFELGCHVIDPMVRLMGRPRNVTATLHKDGAYADTLRDNSTTAVLHRADGLVPFQRKLRTTYDENLLVQEALLRCSGMYS